MSSQPASGPNSGPGMSPGMDAPSTTGGAIPETLGRYRLLSKIAKGGMAEVFAARSYGVHGFEKTVALKRILPKFGQDPQFVRMMVDEAKISVLLNHPNIAQILELGEQDGDYFIVMEFVAGQSLSAMVKRLKETGERLPQLEACFVVVELLQGLHAAHSQTDMSGTPAGIIHRDVSPQNTLLSFDGHVKVIDFGIARARDRLEATEVGTIKGKLRYLAPEMIDPGRFTSSGDFDHRVDVFAAGICLWELIAGRTLFPGDDELKVYDDITDGSTPDLHKERICDAALMKIIGKALERRLDKRYASAEEFADDLRSYVYRTDPGFTHKRVAAILDKYFPDEKQELTALERGQSPGDSSQQSQKAASRQAAKKVPAALSSSHSGKNPIPASGPAPTAADPGADGPAETRHMRSDKHAMPQSAASAASSAAGGRAAGDPAALSMAATQLVDVGAVDPGRELQDRELPRNKDVTVVTLVSRQHVMATNAASKVERSDSSGVFSMPDDATVTVSADTMREEKARIDVLRANGGLVGAISTGAVAGGAGATRPERVNRGESGREGAGFKNGPGTGERPKMERPRAPLSSSSTLPDETPMTRQAPTPSSSSSSSLEGEDRTNTVRNRLIAASATVGVLLALGIVAVVEVLDGDKPPVAVTTTPDETNPTNPTSPTNPTTPTTPTTPTGDGAVVPAAQEVKVTIRSPVPGAVVVVGDRRGPAPLTVVARPGESLEVRVSAPGARDEGQMVRVPDGKGGAPVADVVVDVAPRWLPVAVQLQIEPTAAEVLIDGEVADKNTTVEPGVVVVVDVSAPGHLPVRQEIKPTPGVPLLIKASLQREDKKAPPKKPANPTNPNPTNPTGSTNSTSAQKGTLSLKTTPFWGQVTIDGKVYDEQTPLTVQLAAGRHDVVVAHPPKGLVRKFKVVVKAGETLTRTITFD